MSRYVRKQIPHTHGFVMEFLLLYKRILQVLNLKYIKYAE